MPLNFHAIPICLGLIGAAILSRADGAPPGPLALEPLPAVVASAAAHGIPLSGLTLASAGAQARTDDRITVLFAVEEGARIRQWFTEFRRVPLTEIESNSKPGSGLGLFSAFLSSLKTDTGHEYGFRSSPAALELRTFGPFASGPATPGADQPAAETIARVLASREYLTHGLAAMCEIELRLRAAGKKDPGLSYRFHPHYSAEQMTRSKERADAAGFTSDDERVFAESFFALIQFAQLAFRTDGIAAITREILDSPTLFSGAFIRPDWAGLKIEADTTWAMPNVRVFRVPYFFRSRTQARGFLFVTDPRPPLQNIAGIAGLTIDWSSKAPTKRLIMRVLAGHPGPQ